MYSLNRGFRRGTEIYVKTEQVLKHKYNLAYPNHHHSCSDNVCFARANTELICSLDPLEINQNFSLVFMRLRFLPPIYDEVMGSYNMAGISLAMISPTMEKWGHLTEDDDIAWGTVTEHSIHSVNPGGKNTNGSETWKVKNLYSSINCRSNSYSWIFMFA